MACKAAPCAPVLTRGGSVPASVPRSGWGRTLLFERATFSSSLLGASDGPRQPASLRLCEGPAHEDRRLPAAAAQVRGVLEILGFLFPRRMLPQRQLPARPGWAALAFGCAALGRALRPGWLVSERECRYRSWPRGGDDGGGVLSSANFHNSLDQPIL